MGSDLLANDDVAMDSLADPRLGFAASILGGSALTGEI
jgi:hypothetical protein